MAVTDTRILRMWTLCENNCNRTWLSKCAPARKVQARLEELWSVGIRRTNFRLSEPAQFHLQDSFFTFASHSLFSVGDAFLGIVFAQREIIRLWLCSGVISHNEEQMRRLSHHFHWQPNDRWVLNYFTGESILGNGIKQRMTNRYLMLF